MYFITAMKYILNENTRFDSKEAEENDTRCFGYFKDKEKAIEAVKRNTFDMHETMYTYIVIEEVEEGIHPYAEIVQWFKYDRESNTYKPIEIDKTGFCNYAIG